MLLHESGKENEKVAVMIHGLCMSWQMLEDAIRQLSASFHVIAVAVPGMDPDSKNEFSTVEEIASDIENALLEKEISEIDCLYGLSMGGGIVIRILADNRICVKNAVIDAGITPYELPYPVTRLILVKDVLLTLLGRASKPMLEMAFPPQEYTEEAVDRMFRVMRQMTIKTIWRAYDSTDNYSMPMRFPGIGTDIWYWYGSKEKTERKPDLIYVKKHIPGIHFRKIQGMKHGQYVMTRPEQFAGDIEKICRKIDGTRSCCVR